jgi:hypothetical protein
MLLRDNQDLFNTIKALSGVNDFTTEETQNLVDLTNRRLTMAYNTSPMWDRYVVVGEKRNVSAFTINEPVIPYIEGPYQLVGNNVNDPNYPETKIYLSTREDPVYGFNGLFTTTVSIGSGTPYKAWVIASNCTVDRDGFVNTGPSLAFSNGTYVTNPWQVSTWFTSYSSAATIDITEGTAIVPYNMHNKDDIQDFIRIHKGQSFLNNSSVEYDFYVDRDGAHILNAGSSLEGYAYVTYKKPIVDQTTGVVISSLTSGKQIPSEFFNYTAHAVYADFLRMDGQHDKAAFEEEKAGMFLATELERIDIINNNNSLNHKISTYVNRSTR